MRTPLVFFHFAVPLETADPHARTLTDVSQLHLRDTSGATAAPRQYERAGFQVWGSEPDALICEGPFSSIGHLMLRLD